MSNKQILFAWSGGGMVGLDIHMGTWLALEESGIVSTHNRGTSAGAIMSAMNSTGESAQFYHEILLSLTNRDVKRSRMLWKLRLPFISYILSGRPVAKMLEKYILPEAVDPTFDNLAKGCGCCCTNERNGRTVTLTSGPIRRAVQASAAIAGVFPPVTLPDGRQVSDGGTTAYLPFFPEDVRSYDEIWLLVAAPPLDFKDRAKNVIARLRRNIDWMTEDQISDILDACAVIPNVYVVRPNVATPEGSMHFDHDLIDECRQQALGQIEREYYTKRGDNHEQYAKKTGQ